MGDDMTLGPPIRPKPVEKPEVWEPTQTKGVERNSKTGAVRTNIPANEAVNNVYTPSQIFKGLVPDLPTIDEDNA